MASRMRVHRLTQAAAAQAAAVTDLMGRRYASRVRHGATADVIGSRLLQDLDQAWTAGRDALAATLQQQERVTLPVARMLAWFLVRQAAHCQAAVATGGDAALLTELEATPGLAPYAAAIVHWCQATPRMQQHEGADGTT